MQQVSQVLLQIVLAQQVTKSHNRTLHCNRSSHIGETALHTESCTCCKLLKQATSLLGDPAPFIQLQKQQSNQIIRSSLYHTSLSQDLSSELNFCFRQADHGSW